MNTTLWIDLHDEECELISGGSVSRTGENPYNGVPFTTIITPGQGRTSPNDNGFSNSGRAIPNAYGAPLVINGG
jgi:hypothetical protein